MKPLVSVIMPVYNGEEFVSDTIHSVLEQTYRDFEFIIVNDGSTDGTEEKVLAFNDQRIRYVRNYRNKGLIYSLNRALDMMNGSYMARIDADDIADPARFTMQVRLLESDPFLAICGSFYHIINKRGEVQRTVELPVDDGEIRSYLLFGNCLCHSSVMMRAEAVQEYKYNEDYELCEDYDLWFRMIKRHKVRNIPYPLVSYRVHGENISVRKREGMLRCVRAIHARFLDAYNIPYTQEELLIHTSLLAFDHAACKEIGLQKVMDWMVKLVRSVHSSGVIDVSLAVRVLTRRWMVVCSHLGRVDLLVNNPLFWRYGFLYLRGVNGKALDKLMNRDRGLDL